MLLQFVKSGPFVGHRVERARNEVPEGGVIDHHEDFVDFATVEDLVEELKSVLVGFCRRVGADHFQQGEAEAEGVELLSVALFEVPLALAEFRLGGGVGALLFFLGVDVFDADVADLDLPVV